MTKNKTAIIIGAGPAGLTAAYELLKRTNIKPIILEATDNIGGIAQTVNYKGNRMDIGGHRFFSKSQRVIDWWLKFFTLENNLNPEEHNKVMLLRKRISRIFFLRKFFNYPVSLNWQTFKNLGFWRILKITCSYLYICIFPIKSEKNLEDFFINRFGKELYLTFFKDYTEKVWGISCDKISAEWGAQRIKGLSITKTIMHAFKKILPRKKTNIQQKNVETSLIEQFMYPKYGPGQLWETVADEIISLGGEIRRNHQAISLYIENDNNCIIEVKNNEDNSISSLCGNLVFSTMPVKNLISNFKNDVPAEVADIANNLKYRDFITVGLLLNKIESKNTMVQDNWIYIQERDVKIGRLQIFNNWSPYMVKNSDTIFMGLEYFCNENDELWLMSNEEFIGFAINEMEKINLINKYDVVDYVVVKMPKTYPVYFGAYSQFDKIKHFTSQFKNLFLIGRNGMHRYNNMDHSMLTAMVAVDNIQNEITTKENIWQVNTEDEYHESDHDKKKH